MLNDIKRYMECHDSWVFLYDTFVTNPVLSRFLNMALSELKHTEEENIPKIYAMKKAIIMMADVIDDNLNIREDNLHADKNKDTGYDALLEFVSEKYRLDESLLNFIVSIFEEFKDVVYNTNAKIFQYASDFASIEVNFCERSYQVLVSGSLMQDIQSLYNINHRRK